MKVGIVGLGLIGGSFAKAYHAAGWEVLAADIDRQMLDFAMLQGAVNGELTEDAQADCDLILIAVYPRAAVEYLQKHGAKIGKKPVVIDCCGTKRVVCEACFPLADQYGFTYLGGHPMAGTHNSGFKYATATMYHGAPMVLVPADFNNIELLSRVKELLSPAGFGRFSVTTAEKHDEMIAFTSQMARVAWLNPQMWAELFLENKDYLMRELNILIENLQKYELAMEQNDLPGLTALLDEGRRRKEEVDGH